jgi:membrane protease YdiL (CAAX protease family)
MDDTTDINKWVRILAVFYGIELAVCAIVNYTAYFGGLYWLFITEVSLGFLAAVFLMLILQDIRYIFSWKSFSFPKALVYSAAAVLLAVVVNVLIRWLNRKLFHRDMHFYRSFLYLKYPKLAMLMLVVFLPAFFEELAYRGIILESLLRLADRRRAIFLSAILFAVVHMSFISFFWLVPFAIWLGNVRDREGTIWYGVLIHFFFNGTACLFEILV